MNVWVLTENTACREDLTPEHGLSLYIETGDQRILFDAGQSSAFWENGEKMGIDLSRVTMAVLSHGHYDHGGGLRRFLEGNRDAKIYVNQFAFQPHYHGPDRYIGLDPDLKHHPQVVLTQGTETLAPGIRLCTCAPAVCPIDPAGLEVLEEGRLRPEDFRHEQYLLVEEGEKTILFSGCSHRGIRNIAAAFQPEVLIGGFHLMKCRKEQVLEATARELLTYKTQYYTGHCTGAAQFGILKQIMGPRLEAISAGTRIHMSS